jgi:hypothetical protein
LPSCAVGLHFAQPLRPEARPATCLAQLRRREPGTSYSAQRRRPQVAPLSAQPSAAWPAQQWYRAPGLSRHSAQLPATCLAQPRRSEPGTSYSAQRRRPQVAPHSAQPPASYFAQPLAAGSSAGAFVSWAGRGRRSGGDETIRWRCAPDPMTWLNQVITLCAILESDGRALGGVGGCCPCAWAEVAANNCRDRKNVAAPNALDFMVLPPAARDNERNVRPACSSSCLHASFPAPAGSPPQHR